MKTVYKIGMLAVAALAFAGCSKEVETQKEIAGTHTLTFTVQKDIDTKTAVQEGDGVASYFWTEGDEAYFHIYENGKEATEIVMGLSEDHKIATFLATFSNTQATEFTYTATYGSNLSNAGNPLIPSNQKPALDSFDPAADVLVSAESITFEGNAKAAEDAEFQFKLKRVVSANKMTLKGLVAGEVISKVELASDMYFSSRYGVEKETYTGDAKKLVLDYSGKNAVVGDDGTFPVYFISGPVTDATFSVIVTTDQHVYTRDDFTSKLTFAVGTFRRFGINLSGYGEAISSGTKYTLVESDDELYSGATYLIVGNGYALGEQKSNNRNAVAVTDTDGVITIDNTIPAYPVVIEEVAGGFTIMDITSGKYLYTNNTSNNRLLEREAIGTDDYAVWSISVADDVASISNVGNTSRGLMCFNPNNGSPMFACYGSVPANSTDELALYVDKSTCKELADPELSFDETSFDVDWEDIEDFAAPAVKNPHNLTVSYSSSDVTVATVDAATGEVTILDEGTTTITARSEKTNDFKAGSASYTLTVSGKPIELDFTTVAELNALAADEAGEVTGTLTDAIVTFVPGTSDAIIKDATGSILYHKSGHGLKQGQTFTGQTTVTTTLYYGVCEITAIDAKFVGDETVVEPETVALATIAGDYNTWQGAYVKIENLEVDSVSGKNVYVKNGDGTYLVYSNAGNASCVAGDIITAIGTVTKYSNNPQLKVWFTKDIVITQHQAASHKITYSQPAEGGSFTVKVDGTAIASGIELEEGTVVSLNATASEGYVFSGWTVSGATLSGNTSSATFTVGTSDITISAAFRSVDSESVVYTLDGTVTGGTNGYASESEIEQGDITWMVMGNTTMSPWRIGGKGDAERTVYSTNSLDFNISKIEITHGSNSLTVNSMTVIVASDADFENVLSTFTPTFVANGTVTVERPSGANWSECYYKIVYNLSASTSSNQYFQLEKVEFTGK